MRALGFEERHIDMVTPGKGVKVPWLGGTDCILKDQYPWRAQADFSAEELQQKTAEQFERGVMRGTYVPAPPDVVVQRISPWTTVVQGDKIRPCMDLTGGLVNDSVAGWPFKLPTPMDLAQHVLPGRSRLVSHDVSDGFWTVHVDRADWGLFGVRHPITEQVFVATRLVFGYKNAPLDFCEFTEAVARRFELLVREQLHGYCQTHLSRQYDFNVSVYVDDFIQAVTDRSSAPVDEVELDAAAGFAKAVFEELLIQSGWSSHPTRPRVRSRCCTTWASLWTRG